MKRWPLGAAGAAMCLCMCACTTTVVGTEAGGLASAQEAAPWAWTGCPSWATQDGGGCRVIDPPDGACAWFGGPGGSYAWDTLDAGAPPTCGGGPYNPSVVSSADAGLTWVVAPPEIQTADGGALIGSALAGQDAAPGSLPVYPVCTWLLLGDAGWAGPASLDAYEACEYQCLGATPGLSGNDGPPLSCAQAAGYEQCVQGIGDPDLFDLSCGQAFGVSFVDVHTN